LRADFRTYRQAKCGGSWVERESSTSGVDGSYWLLFPVLLHDKHAGTASCLPGTLLGDALWAQYCVFLSVRTRDDLLDGQTRLRRVAGAVDRLQVEARQTLARHLPRGSRFWPFLERAVETTDQAIAEVDRLQRSADGMPPDSLACYARVGEIFKIGSAAVCMALGRTGDLGPVGRCCDHLAIASQLLDDLVDLPEDLEHGRRSFAASWILRFGRPGTTAGAVTKTTIWDGLVRGHASGALLDRTRGQLRRAARAVAPAHLKAAAALIDRLLREVDLIESHVHRAKVALLFGTRSGTSV
jgi:hypothetical protein